MSDLLDTPILLLLNRGWQPIGHRKVKQALVALCGGSDGIAPAVGLDLDYGTLPDGSWDFSPSFPARAAAVTASRTWSGRSAR